MNNVAALLSMIGLDSTLLGSRLEMLEVLFVKQGYVTYSLAYQQGLPKKNISMYNIDRPEALWGVPHSILCIFLDAYLKQPRNLTFRATLQRLPLRSFCNIRLVRFNGSMPIVYSLAT
jgi:hypothetical protein